MATSLQKRVKQLEGGGNGGSPPCDKCGWGGRGDDDLGPEVTYELVWVDPGGPDDKNEWCGTCGRQTQIVLTWGDEAS